MKDFQSNQLASPPILSGFSMDDLRNQNFSSDFKMVPCHSQHVERFVALTSIAGANAIGKSSFAYCVHHIKIFILSSRSYSKAPLDSKQGACRPKPSNWFHKGRCPGTD